MTRRVHDRSEAVRRFISRTFATAAEQKQHQAEIDALLQEQEQPAQEDSAASKQTKRAEGDFAGEGFHSPRHQLDLLDSARSSCEDEKRCNARTSDDSVSGVHDVNHEISSKDEVVSLSSSSPPRASFLGLPTELRIYIMELVLCTKSFLSSRQQITASSPLKHEGDEEQQAFTKRPRMTRFTHPSSSFKVYAESRQADTAVLYTCRQLRNEGYHLWFNAKYYLTLVIEQGVYTPSPHDRSGMHLHAQDQHHLNPRFIRCADRALQFEWSDQERFWKHVARDLKFPALFQACRFKKFHVSLFVEESAYMGIDQSVGVAGGGLPSAQIVQILMGGHISEENIRLGDDGNGVKGSTAQLARTAQDGHASDAEPGRVKFLDHTYIGLANDAVDDSSALTVGHARSETKLSLSVDLWKI